MLTLNAATGDASTAGLPLVLTVTEAAGVLRISRGLAYQLVGSGQIPSVRLGRRLVVPSVAVLALVAQPLAAAADGGRA
jgi:excisionase family DNA binding protein